MKAEGRLFEEALASLRKWRFLVIGGALWWCCHFLTLYQNDIVSLDPIVGFPDIIWLSCVLATLVVFVCLCSLLGFVGHTEGLEPILRHSSALSAV